MRAAGGRRRPLRCWGQDACWSRRKGEHGARQEPLCTEHNPAAQRRRSAVKLSMGNGGQRRKLLFSLVFLPTQTYFNRQCINFPQVCLLITVSSKTISLLLSQPIFHPVFSPCPGERGSEGAWVGVRLLARAVPPPLRRTFSQGSRFPRSPQNSARFRQYVLPHST